MASSPAPDAQPSAYPEVALLALDTLWFQVAGTLCNLECTHCFISCSPSNHAFEMMAAAQVAPYLAEARRLGVKEYYFTGGEPFLNRELFEILGATLAQGPASVLTNGLLLTPAACGRLRALADASAYSLDIRISLDGWDAATNDPIRGAGTFDRVVGAIRSLAAAGLNPVLTVTEAGVDAGSAGARTRFLGFLREIGLSRPRLKVLPVLRLGAETARTRGYAAWESLAGQKLSAEEVGALQCSTGRMVTSRGVYVCPILIDFPGARLASTLAESLRPFTLRHRACFTCHTQGLSCRT